MKRTHGQSIRTPNNAKSAEKKANQSHQFTSMVNLILKYELKTITSHNDAPDIINEDEKKDQIHDLEAEEENDPTMHTTNIFEYDQDANSSDKNQWMQLQYY